MSKLVPEAQTTETKLLRRKSMYMDDEEVEQQGANSEVGIQGNLREEA